MEIDYILSEEDYLHFNLFHIKNSRTTARALTIQRWIGPVIFVVFSFVFANLDKDLPFPLILIIFLIVSVLWYFLYPKYFFHYVKRQAKKMINEGKNSGLLGRHRMTLTVEGIIDATATGETKVRWSGIQEFKEDTEYLYLYNSSVSAYILPKRDLLDRNKVKKFVLDKMEK